jgi:hypothetical protein
VPFNAAGILVQIYAKTRKSTMYAHFSVRLCTASLEWLAIPNYTV